MRLTILVALASVILSSCAADPAEPEAQAATAAPHDAPPTSTAVTYGDPPPPAISATAGVGVVGPAEVRVVNAGPREVRVYGLREGRRLRARDLTVRRATVMTASGPQVLVLEPREDYYVAVTPFDVTPSARFDIEVAVVGHPAPPAVVAVAGFAPLATVEVEPWVAPSVQVVAPAPPSVRVRGGVRVNAFVPSPRVVVVAPPPPSISIGFGVPSPHVVVSGGHRHHGRGHGVGHIRAHGRGHRRH